MIKSGNVQLASLSLSENHENRVRRVHFLLLSLLQNTKMPQPRTPMGVISSNIQKRKQLTPFQRGEISAAKKFGHKPAEIAKVLKRPDSTVRTTLKVNPLRNDGETRRRSGRPREYDERDVRKL